MCVKDIGVDYAESVFKVEVCNDYSLWPHSGLATTSLAGAPHSFPSYSPSLSTT